MHPDPRQSRAFFPISLSRAVSTRRWYPPARLDRPQISLEIVSEELFRVSIMPGAEQAMASAGGLAAVLAASGLDLSLSIRPPEDGVQDAALDASSSSKDAQEGAEVPATSAGAAASDVPCPDVRAAASSADSAAASEEQVCFRLSDYDRVLASINRARQPLLGSGSAIPPLVLKAYSRGAIPKATAADVEQRYVPIYQCSSHSYFNVRNSCFGRSMHAGINLTHTCASQHAQNPLSLSWQHDIKPV